MKEWHWLRVAVLIKWDKTCKDFLLGPINDHEFLLLHGGS